MLIAEAIKKVGDTTNLINKSWFDIESDLTPEIFYPRQGNDKMAELMVEFMKMGIRKNIVVLGTKGSGKTAIMKYLIKDLKTHYDIDSYYVSCREEFNTYRAMRKLVNIQTRKTNEIVLNSFLNKFNTPRKSFVIFDEVDMMEDDNIFYYMTRKPEFANTFIIMITNKQQFYNDVLTEDVKSSFNHELFSYDDYNLNDIEKIITLRANLAFRRYDKETLHTIAAMNEKYYNSDVRLGLRAALDIFKSRYRADGSEVKSIMHKLNVQQKDEIILRLNENKLLILYLLTKYDKGEVIRKEMAMLGRPYVKSYFIELMNSLVKFDLVTMPLQRKGPHSYTYYLNINEENIETVKNLVKDKMVIKYV